MIRDKLDPLLLTQVGASLCGLNLLLSNGLDHEVMKWVVYGAIGLLVMAWINRPTPRSPSHPVADRLQTASSGPWPQALGLLACAIAVSSLIYSVAVYAGGVSPAAVGSFYIGNMIALGARLGDSLGSRSG